MDLVRVHRRRKSTAPATPKPVVEEEAEKPSLTEPTSAGGAVRGEVKYPWGAVAQAAITLGEKFTRTDENGKYEILAIDPGTYSLSAKAPFPGYESVNQTITLALGETKTVDLYLDFEKTIVEGYVYDQDNKPISEATVSGIRSGKVVENAVTDEKGHFRFEKASPGQQFIRINARGYVGQNQDFTAKKDQETHLDFHLTPGTCRISGTLLDEKERPLSGEIVLSSASGVILQKTQSDAANGYYEFAVMPGTYNLLANKAGYQSRGWRGSISADQSLEFRLEPSVPLGAPAPSDRSPAQDFDPRRPRVRW